MPPTAQRNRELNSARFAGEHYAMTDLEDGLRYVPSYAAQLGASCYSNDVELQAAFREAYMRCHNALVYAGKVHTA